VGLTAYPDAVPTSKKPLPPDGARPAPRLPALDPPMLPFAIAGMAIWAVVGLALLPFQDTLRAHGHGDWLAICLAGFLWGFPGVAVMIRHDANRRRRRAG
jgi:hypothetical protein